MSVDHRALLHILGTIYAIYASSARIMLSRIGIQRSFIHVIARPGLRFSCKINGYSLFGFIQ